MDKVEQLNSITHLIGTAAALAGMSVLVVIASMQGNPWKIVTFTVYGLSLCSVYLSSTLFHSLSGNKKIIFRKLDHAAIYLLIAGTYTPFTLISLRGVWGWSIFGVVWGLAVIGILLDTLVRIEQRIIPVFIYILMGWIGLIAVKPLLAALSFAGFMWLLSGGIFYTLGVIFFAMDDRKPYYHSIWHLFVLAGSVSHYVAIALYVK